MKEGDMRENLPIGEQGRLASLQTEEEKLEEEE